MAKSRHEQVGVAHPLPRPSDADPLRTLPRSHDGRSDVRVCRLWLELCPVAAQVEKSLVVRSFTTTAAVFLFLLFGDYYGGGGASHLLQCSIIHGGTN